MQFLGVGSNNLICMKAKNYYQQITSTLYKLLDYKGRAGRTEYAYFIIFYVSCPLLIFDFLLLFLSIFGFEVKDLININPHFFIINSPVLKSNVFLILFSCLLGILCIFCLFLFFAKMSLSFRRCRDIGKTMLGFCQFIPIVNFI